MPEHTINTDAELERLLERVRVQQGFATVEQALEWLVKARIRRNAREADGRGRALYLVADREPKA